MVKNYTKADKIKISVPLQGVPIFSSQRLVPPHLVGFLSPNGPSAMSRPSPYGPPSVCLILQSTSCDRNSIERSCAHKIRTILDKRSMRRQRKEFQTSATPSKNSRRHARPRKYQGKREAYPSRAGRCEGTRTYIANKIKNVTH